MVGSNESGLLLHQPDPVFLELNRLHNLLKEKDLELGFAQNEIKALKFADVLKEKSLQEMGNMVEKQENKIRITEKLLEQKNLDIKKLATEKKEAVAAQFAAEATLRRVHANQKDDNLVPIESIIAPLESDIRMYKNEIAYLQEDKKTLERNSKLKEAALLEAERILRNALERTLIVEEVQNQNMELRRQIEICQEENKILEKINRQKVLEVEKLSEAIKELEEAILAGGAAANTIRDYMRQIYELQEEKRTLERELARANISANRVATTVANEWKDENDKLMPVKQCLEERRLLQAEMQRLRDKLTISERTAKSEAQLKEKVKLRLKTLEDGLKQSICGSPKLEKSSHFFAILSSNEGRKNNKMIIENTSGVNLDKFKDDGIAVSRGRETTSGGSEDTSVRSSTDDDLVSGFLYDRLQKEVISLRKFCEMKDSSLNAKTEENKVLMKKIENLIKSLEVESKKWKREASLRDKNLTSITTDDPKPVRNLNSSKSFRAAKRLEGSLEQSVTVKG